MSTALAMVLAVMMDAWLGEPRRWHPLVLFGRLARFIESHGHADRRVAGVLAWGLAVLPLVAVTGLLEVWWRRAAPWLWFALEVVVLYLVIGLRSLADHALPVARALTEGDLAGARTAVGRMVSRDTFALDDTRVAAAATESVLENGNDAVFGALFWFALLGAPGAVLYRLANTLDAMWGYRTERYECYGWAAARIDDVLNFLPARLTALSYVLLGDAPRAWRCWRVQATRWDSPNAGPVMASGAGALGVQLGGAAPYDGVWESRPELGEGARPDAHAIVRALQLVRRSVVLWLVVAVTLGLAQWSASHA
ncbi:adenosylcobinamide-phosphate synthase CbiB [Dyella telluris]|uniref:Cobalamin biosynthesis protein CobD n=1 Tax=Dyella telluris TaxID=2763498 RepID=A0A7G8Q061_9GAMM|nr:adenosylcobinamide-phosphate synthase CbiB [Dyella telluris]QNK00169.1 cobalamin biosynthesis protein [Dyella telluris]